MSPMSINEKINMSIEQANKETLSQKNIQKKTFFNKICKEDDFKDVEKRDSKLNMKSLNLDKISKHIVV